MREWVRRLDGVQLTPAVEQALHCAAVMDSWLDARATDCRRHLERATEVAGRLERSHPSTRFVTGVEAYLRGAADEMVAILDPDRNPDTTEYWWCQVGNMRLFGLVIGGRHE